MRVSLETRDFAKYPFLKESQQYMLRENESLEKFLQRSAGKVALSHAVERVRQAVAFTGPTLPSSSVPELPSDQLGVRLEITSFVLARVLVSCARDRALMERLARYEAQRPASDLRSQAA